MSRLAFRNVDADPDSPVEGWPAEALEAALDRGGLAEWTRIAEVVRREPWGGVARGVEAVLSYSSPYGVAPLMERAIASARADVDAADRAEAARQVRHHLERSGLTRSEAATLLGTSASRLSTYATGRVTPSAAFMVALQRLGDRRPR